MLKKLDLFSGDLPIEHNLKSRVYTKVGGVLTILLFLYTGILIWRFGTEFISNKAPLFNLLKQKDYSYPSEILKSQEFIFEFSLEGISNNPLSKNIEIKNLKDKDHFKIEIGVTNIRRKNSDISQRYFTIPLKTCWEVYNDDSNNENIENTESNQNIIFHRKNSYCIDMSGFSLGGYLNNNELSFITLKIFHNHDINYHGKNNDEKFNDYYIRYKIRNPFVNPEDYSHPFITNNYYIEFLKLNSIFDSNFLQTEEKTLINRNTIYTDNGWFFRSTIQDSMWGIENIISQKNFVNINDPKEDILLYQNSFFWLRKVFIHENIRN